MQYTEKFNLKYTPLSPGECLYEDIDLETERIVDAQYQKVYGYENNPDICALPDAAVGQEAYRTGIYTPAIFYNNDWDQISLRDQLYRSHALRNVRVPMPYQVEVNRLVIDLLIESYSNRKTTQAFVSLGCETPEFISVNRLRFASNPSSGIFGTAGTGKSSAINIALERIPLAIRHSVAGGYYTQIPVMTLTAFPNSNMKSLLVSFASKLDEILNTGCLHSDEINKRKTLGAMAEKIIRWIKIYHIGLVVIDEVQFLEMNSNRDSSIETLVTITSETCCGLLVSGNQDAVHKWSENLRLMRRLERTPVYTDVACTDPYMRTIIRQLWSYTVFAAKKITLTDELVQVLLTESLGSIDIVSLLIIKIQDDWLLTREKIRKLEGTTDPASMRMLEKFQRDLMLTAAKIRDTANRIFSKMKSLFQDNLINSQLKYVEERERLQKTLKQLETETSEDEQLEIKKRLAHELSTGYNHSYALREVLNAITDTCDSYTERQIISAFNYAEKEDPTFSSRSRKDRVRATLQCLQQRAEKHDRSNKTSKNSAETSKRKSKVHSVDPDKCEAYLQELGLKE